MQNLFTGTFILTLLCAPLCSPLAARVKLTRLLPGVFWFLLVNLLIFYVLFHVAPHDRWVAAGYFWWFSAVNLFLISVFWTLMADIFSPAQATRLFRLHRRRRQHRRHCRAAHHHLCSCTAWASADCCWWRRRLSARDCPGASADAGKDAVARPGGRFPAHHAGPQPARQSLWRLRAAAEIAHMLGQAAFMLLMTWIATILYFLQTDLISRAYPVIESRTIAFADVDLFVNICSAVILIFGLGRVMQRFGVTVGLVLTPLLMVRGLPRHGCRAQLDHGADGARLQRITQYAVARPSREVLFTVVDQQSKYKAKNVIDTVVYRFGDLTAAWMQAGLRAAGFGLAGVVGLGRAGVGGLGRHWPAAGPALRDGAPPRRHPGLTGFLAGRLILLKLCLSGLGWTTKIQGNIMTNASPSARLLKTSPRSSRRRSRRCWPPLSISFS